METVIQNLPDMEVHVNLPIFPGKINGFPVKVLKCGDSADCYMTIKCVEKCQLSSRMDAKCPGYIMCSGESKMLLLGTVMVPISFQRQLSNGEMEEAHYLTLFYVTKTDVAEVVLGKGFPACVLPGNKVKFGRGIIPCLPRDEWDEPARSCDIMSFRSLYLYDSKETQA